MVTATPEAVTFPEIPTNFTDSWIVQYYFWSSQNQTWFLVSSFSCKSKEQAEEYQNQHCKNVSSRIVYIPA